MLSISLCAFWLSIYILGKNTYLDLLLPIFVFFFFFVIVTLKYLLKRRLNICLYKTNKRIFIATLFLITKKQTQSKYTSIGEWIKKLLYIHTVDFYSILKRNELYLLQYGWTSRTLFQAKETRPKIPFVWHFFK